jgi:ubiquinone/menaquinone biosynthesis C-methylase UbiE
VELSDGSPRLPAGDGEYDRFVSTYVLDLLSAADTVDLLAEAHRVLRPGGTHGGARAAPLAYPRAAGRDPMGARLQGHAGRAPLKPG